MCNGKVRCHACMKKVFVFVEAVDHVLFIKCIAQNLQLLLITQFLFCHGIVKKGKIHY